MNKILISTAATFFLLASNSYADGVKKNITIIANINDSIFVSKPDGSTWYDTEELNATDYKQKNSLLTISGSRFGLQAMNLMFPYSSL